MAENTTVDRTCETRYRALFADGEPIRVKDLATATAASRPDHDDKHNNEDDKERKFKGFGVRATRVQLICAVAAMEATWQIAQDFQEEIDAIRQGTRGRRPGYTAFDAVVFLCGTYIFGGATAMHFEINPDLAAGPAESLWQTINRRLDAARPDRPEQRLSASFSRFCHDRVRKEYLDGTVLNKLERAAMGHCVDALLSMGQFNPSSGTYTLPDSTQLIVADGCKVDGLYNNTDPTKLTKRGNPRNCDREAFTPEAEPGKTAPGPNFEYCMLFSRTPYPQERMLLGCYIKGEAQRSFSDATLCVQVLAQLLEERTEVIEGLYGFGYDMALPAADRDWLLKTGIQPIAKLRRVTKEKPVMRNYGEQVFTHKTLDETTGVTTETIALATEVIAIDGTKTVIMPNGDGDDCYVPLSCIRRYRVTQRTSGYAVYNDLALPDHPIVPKHQQGATISMRMDTPLEELKLDKNTRRPGTISSIPESDPHFEDVFGCREDAESSNRDLKAMLRDKRCITKSRDNNRYQALGFQLLQLARAMLAHAKRTNDHHTEIFGQLLVPDEQQQQQPPPPKLTIAA
ncbi:hypothetical protein [Candidatus Poriferisodalis sp.]|uniref:hypothetical protein n=1 Tax=Candidatus Poriferisodalis sp. TaxID=3101277 RepID=UPI003B0284D3